MGTETTGVWPKRMYGVDGMYVKPKAGSNAGKDMLGVLMASDNVYWMVDGTVYKVVNGRLDAPSALEEFAEQFPTEAKALIAAKERLNSQSAQRGV